MWHAAARWTDPMKKRTRPRSCHGGTQLTKTSPRAAPASTLWSACRYARTLRWRIMAARGSPDVPEVGWMYAMSSGVRRGSGGAVSDRGADSIQPSVSTSRGVTLAVRRWRVGTGTLGLNAHGVAP